MSRQSALYAVLSFVLGATTVLVAKSPKVIFDPKAYYAGNEPKAASAALLAQGEKLAGGVTDLTTKARKYGEHLFQVSGPSGARLSRTQSFLSLLLALRSVPLCLSGYSAS